MLLIGGLVVAMLFAALLAPFFVDWTSFRQDFEREASRIMGRTVVVHGGVDARILPFPSVTLSDVRVGDPEDGAPLVEVARFSMDAELAPFLSGEALIFDMRLEEPRVRLKLFADGTLDWARGRRSAIPARTVVLENVTVSGGEITFVDEQTGRTRHLAGLDAQISARSLAGPWRIEGRASLDGQAGAFQLASGQADGKALPLRAHIVPDALPFLADLDGTVTIADFRPSYQGAFTLSQKQAEEASADAIRVAGQFELSNERLRVPEYRLEAGAREDPYVVTGEATLDTGAAPEFLLIADGQQIDVGRIGASGEAGKTGRDPQLSLRQRLQALMAIAADIPIPQVPGRASLALPAVVIGDTTLREIRLDVTPDGDGWKIGRADALLPGRTALEAKGRLALKGRRGFVGDLVVASSQPSGLAAWLAGVVDPEIRQLKSAGFSARVDLREELQRFEALEIAVGPATLTGRLERESREGAAPTLSATLAGDTMRLDSLRALVGLVAGDVSAGGVFSHRIALDLKAGRFEAFGEEAEGVDAVLSLDAGAVTLDRLDVAALAGARLSAKGTLSGLFTTPGGSLEARLTAAEMRPVAELLSRHLPAHPALARFTAAAGYYDDADLTLRVTLPGADGGAAALTLAGPVNDGRVELRLAAAAPADLLSGRAFELEASLFNPRTVVLAGQAGLDPLPFDAEPDGSMTLRALRKAGEPAEVTATFRAGETALIAKGTASLAAEDFLSGTLAVSLESGDLEPYLLMNGIALPQAGTGLAATLSATVETTAEAVSVSGMTGKVDRNAFSGDLALDRTAAILAARGALSFDSIDFAYLAEAVAGPVTDPLEGGLNAAALARPILDTADIAVRLEAGAFRPGLYGAVADFRGDLAWKGGELALTDMEGDWLGGRLSSGRLKVANAEENGLFEARAELAGIDLSKLAWPVARGRADVTLAIDGAGKSARAMAEGASGSGELRLSGLVLSGVDTGVFPALLSAADGIEGEITEEAAAGIAAREILRGETVIGELAVPVALAGGRLRVQSVAAGDGRARLSGDADIDLAGGGMSGRLSLAFEAGEEALAGAEPEVVLGFRGAVAAPEFSLDAGPLANYLSLRRFEAERRRVETLQANVLEKQRLRREAALYRARAEARAAKAEAERLYLAEEERRRAEARERSERERRAREAAAEAERKRREAMEETERQRRAAAEETRRRIEAAQEAARSRAEERARQAEERTREKRLPALPGEGVERGGELPPVERTPAEGGSVLDFGTLPKVN